MKSENHWQKEVEKSIDLLENIGRVAPSDEFESAVMDRIKSESLQLNSWSIPAVAAVMVFLIGLNLFSIFTKNKALEVRNTNPVTSFYQLEVSEDVYDKIFKK